MAKTLGLAGKCPSLRAKTPAAEGGTNEPLEPAPGLTPYTGVGRGYSLTYTLADFRPLLSRFVRFAPAQVLPFPCAGAFPIYYREADFSFDQAHGVAGRINSTPLPLLYRCLI